EPLGDPLDDASVDPRATDLEGAGDLARPVGQLARCGATGRAPGAVVLRGVHDAAFRTARRSRSVAEASSARAGVSRTPTTAASSPATTSSVRASSWARVASTAPSAP